MHAPTGMLGVLHIVGATIGRPICINTQFAMSVVQRRAGSEAARECKKTINYRFPSSVTEPAGENLRPAVFVFIRKRKCLGYCVCSSFRPLL